MSDTSKWKNTRNCLQCQKAYLSYKLQAKFKLTDGMVIAADKVRQFTILLL